MSAPTNGQELPERLTETFFTLNGLPQACEFHTSQTPEWRAFREEVIRRYNSHAALTAEVERLRALAEGGDGLAGHTWKAMWNGLRGKIEEQRGEISALTARVKELEEAGRNLLNVAQRDEWDQHSEASNDAMESLRVLLVRRALGASK